MARHWTAAEKARQSRAMKAHWEKKKRSEAHRAPSVKAPSIIVSKPTPSQPVSLYARLKGMVKNLLGISA